MNSLYNYLTLSLDGETKYRFDESRTHIIYVDKFFRDNVVAYLNRFNYNYSWAAGGYDAVIVRNAAERADIHILFVEED